MRLRDGADELGDDVAVPERLHGRDAADAVLEREALVRVGVELRERDARGGGRLLEDRPERTARPAPLRPEVDDDRLAVRALDHLCLPRLLRDVHGTDGSYGGALLGDGLEPAADLVHVGAEVVDARQRGERLEPEDALEERRRAVADRAELVVAAAFGDEPALDETGDDAVDVDAADARDLRDATPARGTRRSRASRAPPARGRARPASRTAARTRPTPPREARNAQPPATCSSTIPLRSSREPLLEDRERLLDLRRIRLGGRGELVDRQRLRGDHEQRLERPCELERGRGVGGDQAETVFQERLLSASAREILIGANGAACAIAISFCLRSSSSARNATAISTRESPATSWSKSKRRAPREAATASGRGTARPAGTGAPCARSTAPAARPRARAARRRAARAACGASFRSGDRRERRRPEPEMQVAALVEPLAQEPRRLLRAPVLGEPARELLGRLLGLELGELGVLLREHRARLQLEQRADQDQELAARVEVELAPLGEMLDERDDDRPRGRSRGAAAPRGGRARAAGRTAPRTRRGPARARARRRASPRRVLAATGRGPWGSPSCAPASAARGASARAAAARAALVQQRSTPTAATNTTMLTQAFSRSPAMWCAGSIRSSSSKKRPKQYQAT